MSLFRRRSHLSVESAREPFPVGKPPVPMTTGSGKSRIPRTVQNGGGGSAAGGNRPVSMGTSGNRMSGNNWGGQGAAGSGLAIGAHNRGSRGGSLFGSRPPQKFKDSRNLTDKRVQHQMLLDIINFLTHHQYPSQINKKQWTKTDFQNVFQFCYRMLDHTYMCGPRIEEEIPRLFKDLGYPVVLNKSTMQTIGAAHSWHNILGALHWLITIIQSCIETDIAAKIFPVDGDFQDEGVRISQLRFTNNMLSYSRFCQDGESASYDDLNKHFADEILKLEMEDSSCSPQALERLEKELEALENAPREDEKLEDEIMRLKQDLLGFENFEQKTHEWMKGQQANVSLIQEHRAQAQDNIELLKADVAQLKQTISSQTISAAEVRQLRFKKQEVQQQINILKEDFELRQQEQWDLEKDLSRLGTLIEKKNADFVQKARLLLNKIQPKDQNWDSMVELDKSPFDPKFTEFCTETLKKQLRMLLRFCNDEVHKTENLLTQLDNTATEYQDEIKEIDAEIESILDNIQQKDKDLAHCKEIRAAELQRLKSELKVQKKQLDDLRKMKDMTCEERTGELKKIREENEMLHKEQEVEISAAAKALRKSVTAFIEHKESLLQQRRTALTRMENVLQQIENSDLFNDD